MVTLRDLEQWRPATDGPVSEASREQNPVMCAPFYLVSIVYNVYIVLN